MATIYFSGSITGGRGDVAVYRQIVTALESEGHRVLAGMVTSIDLHEQGESLPSRQIFERDIGWLEEVARDGGLLVADVSLPSTGVGYEIAAARYRFGIPVIALYRPAHTKRCTAMVTGDAGIEFIEYTDDSIGAMLRALSATVAEMDAGRAEMNPAQPAFLP